MESECAILSSDADIAIIGAGAAGLACARSLTRAGYHAVVWEARDRIGGRVRTFRAADGRPIELGAQVVHGRDNPLWTLLGPAEPATSFRDARASAIVSGERRPMGTLARATVPPWAVESALVPDLTGSTVAELLATLKVPAHEHAWGTEWIRQNWGTDPEHLDARELARVRHHDDAGTGEYLLARGYERVTRQLAAEQAIACARPVEHIEFTAGHVRLHAGGHVLNARAAVLTAPPPSATSGPGMIRGLPAEKHRAAKRLPSGDACSVIAELSEPAAHDRVIFDADGRGGFLRAFAGCRHALAVAKGKTASWLRFAAENPGHLEGLLSRAGFGGEVEQVHVTDWGLDPYSRGGFSFPVSHLDSAAREWAKPIADTLFFAGEATCGHRWPASVHGAVGSGERAAADVKERLRCQNNPR